MDAVQQYGIELSVVGLVAIILLAAIWAFWSASRRNHQSIDFSKYDREARELVVKRPPADKAAE